MTRVGVGMTLEGARFCSLQCVHVGHIAVAETREGVWLCSLQCVHVGHIAVAETREGAGLCSLQCRNDRTRVPRARVRARIRVRAHTSFCRVLSDSVGFCRFFAEGEWGIDDCRLRVGDCKMAPWSVVSLEWSWVYDST